MHVRSPTTIAILGGNKVAGLALSFLLRGAGYETIILKAPPTRDLLRGVDLLLVSPDMDERRKGSLAILRGNKEGQRIPVLTWGSTIEKKLFAEEGAGASWPVDIGGLASAIEVALAGEAGTGPAIISGTGGREAALH